MPECSSIRCVTFSSNYTAQDVYYRLRAHSGNPFEIAPHGPNTALGGTVVGTTVPEAGVWYRFRLQIRDDGQQTSIRARVWREVDTEPATWEIDAVDTHTSRPRSGRIGVWSFNTGNKYWDDLSIAPLP